MAASKMTFGDKKSEFAKHAMVAIKRDFHLHQNQRRLKPLIFEICNGGYPCSFSDSYIYYRKQGLTFHFDLWYMFSYKELISVLTDDVKNEDIDRPILECLFDHFLSEKHASCLQSLSDMASSGKISELKITTIMALHYFMPLVPNGVYVIDKTYPSRHAVCELCKETIDYGDTSIGNSKVWHGKVDILLKGSIVKVNLEKDMENLSLTDVDEGDEKSTHEEEEDRHIDSDEEKYFTVVEVKTSKNLKKKAKSQVISQVIVNAFLNSSKHKAFFKQFVPSFFVTEKNIRVLLYNCELDIILMSTKMPIWKKEGSGKLDIMTLIRVWLALNYSGTMNKRPDEYKVLLENTDKSNFKNLLSEDAYSLYLTGLQHPMQSDKVLSDSDSDDDSVYETNTHKFALKCLLELTDAAERK